MHCWDLVERIIGISTPIDGTEPYTPTSYWLDLRGPNYLQNQPLVKIAIIAFHRIEKTSLTP